MVMSTRRWASSGVTCTSLEDEAAKAQAANPNVAASAARLRIDLASRDDLLGLVVEGNFLAGLDGRDVHAQSDGVAVSGFNRGIGCFSRADALHPVTHVGRCLRIGSGVGRCRSGLGFFDERETGKEVGFHALLDRKSVV